MPTGQHLLWLVIGIVLGVVVWPYVMSLFTRGKG